MNSFHRLSKSHVHGDERRAEGEQSNGDKQNAGRSIGRCQNP